MSVRRDASSGFAHRQAGLTIVEVMVSITLSLMLLAAIVQVFIGTKQNYAFQRALNEMNENIRYASGQLEFHMRMAGYWGGARGLEMGTGTDWTTYVGNCHNNFPDISPSNARVPALYFVSRQNVPAMSTDCVHRGKLRNRNDVMVASYVNPKAPPSTGTGSIASGDTFIRVDVGGRAVMVQRAASGTADEQFAALADLSDSSNDNISDRLLGTHIYFITECLSSVLTTLSASGACPAASVADHPWLLRTVHAKASTTPEIETVAEGVEHMTFMLLVDQAGTGDTVQFIAADDVRSSTTLGANPWEAVRAVQYQLLVRSTYRDVNAITDTESYSLLNGRNALIDADFPRRLVTGMVQLRNNAINVN